METREYRTADKSTWARGEWDDEPDKMQWPDEATGLPCMIVRNAGGALCGYVGISMPHPMYGKNYNQCVAPEQHRDSHEGDDPDYHYDCTPKGLLDAHGGITFANACRTPSHEDFAQLPERVSRWREEALKFPVGDAARWLKEWAPFISDYEAYKKRCEETGICHVSDGPEVWWFGFDCAHLNDISPAYQAREAARGWWPHGDGEMYRNVAYVQHECRQLAEQLVALSK